MQHMRFAVLALGLGVWACSSAKTVEPCAPSTSTTGSGTLAIQRGTTVTDYALSTSQIEELFRAGSVTVTAGDADGGAGSLAARDPVAFVRMQPTAETIATYDLASLGAQIAYCPSTSAKLVLTSTGALSACVPSGTPVTAPLTGTLAVTSSSKKSIEPPAGAPISLRAQYGTQSQGCN